MADVQYRFCPMCATPMAARVGEAGTVPPQQCGSCGFVHWNNPAPVAAGVVEWEGHILLARNAAWATPMFALITGFIEPGETPGQAVVREVLEETSLTANAVHLIGVYEYMRRNELLIAYHVQASGTIHLSDELADYRLVPLEQIRPWPGGTGHAVADLQRRRGIKPRYISMEAFRAGEGLPPASDGHPPEQNVARLP